MKRVETVRSAWIAYVRVSTAEQADRELSLPAQQRAIQTYVASRGALVTREYVEAGYSGTNPNRPEFRRMLEDVFRPGSDVATIVVHHTSRFTPGRTIGRDGPRNIEAEHPIPRKPKAVAKAEVARV